MKSDGTIACWGSNISGQLNGVPTGTFTSVSAGQNHSCGVKTDGSLVCWRLNSDGQLGAAPAAPSPAPPAGQVGTEYSHTFTSSKGSPQGTFSVSAGELPPGLTLSGAGVLSGTPTEGGDYTFTLTASNGLFADASKQFTITISSNSAPEATNDTYSTNEDAALTVEEPAGVLANDTDADGDTLSAKLVEDVANGKLTLNSSDGSFTYTPNANFNGSDSFTYKASDAKADSAIATVNIAVNALNDAPSFAAGADQTVAEDSGAQSVSWASAISVGPANEIGQNVSFVLTNDNDQLFSAQPSIASNGTLTYTPAADKNGSATVTVKAKDDGGTPGDPSDDAESAPQTFTITVSPVNDDPTVTNGAASMAEDAAPITINFGELVSDIETPNASLDYNVSIASADEGKGTLGSVAGDPTKRTFDSADDFNGTVTINYMVTDRGDPDDCGPAGPSCAAPKSASGTVTITVTSVNDPPTANAQSLTTNEDINKEITLAGNDIEGDTLSYKMTSLPANGKLRQGTTEITSADLPFSLSSNQVTYDPTDNYNNTAETADSFDFKVNDGSVDSQGEHHRHPGQRLTHGGRGSSRLVRHQRPLQHDQPHRQRPGRPGGPDI